MLRIAKLGAGGEGYYLQSVGQEPPGEWLGRGPETAGLVGAVGGAELTSILSGRDPRSGEVLGTARDRVRVTGFDLTFAAPKSVSVLYGLADQKVSEAVAEGHRAAVSAALDYTEDRAFGVRRRTGAERTVEPLDGAFGAAFIHRTSRALDPHLHSHVVVANLGRGPDGRFSALDGRGLYAHAGAIGALYHVQFREELRVRLGVEWGPLDRGRADLVGIGPEVRRGFSQRATAIEAELATYSTSDSGPVRRGGHRAGRGGLDEDPATEGPGGGGGRPSPDLEAKGDRARARSRRASSRCSSARATHDEPAAGSGRIPSRS